VLSAAGIEVQSDKVACVRDWPRPTNLTELRAFLVTCSYYRRFIVGFADLAASLHVLQRKQVPFEWTSKQEEAFNRLKEKLTLARVLGMPMDDGLFYLDSDASEFALGAVLSQIQNGSEMVIAYAPRALSKAERNYDVTKKELLGVVNGLKSFKQYLMGRHFVLRTDHAALQWLRRTPEPMAQLARWLTFIELFDFDVQHRAGIRHGNADGLSRIPIATDNGNGMVRSAVQNQDLSAAAAPESRADTSRDTSNQLEGAVEPDAEPLVVLAETPSSSLSAEASVFISRWARAATLLEAADEVQPVDSNTDNTVVSVSAGEQLQAEQLQDADIGPVLRVRLQRAEALVSANYCQSQKQQKLFRVSGNSWIFTTASSIVDALAKKGVQTYYNFWYRLQRLHETSSQWNVWWTFGTPAHFGSNSASSILGCLAPRCQTILSELPELQRLFPWETSEVGSTAAIVNRGSFRTAPC
jgi:hypothetical protein